MSIEIMQIGVKVDVLSKGLSISYINDVNNSSYNYFIPYTGIAVVGPIKTELDKSNYDYLIGKYLGDYINKVAYFTITTNNQKEFDIYIQKDIKKFPRKSTKKETNILKRIFLASTDKEGLSKEARNFAIFEKCEDAVQHLTELRNEIIESINKGN